ncbi:TetR/AcrR family transcriptional regulator [Chelativorans salis]|uniref:TetR/AcrR family transcriptional regulator n=1 Tax=Chelativorans salis TaxID=2978478 RepID=A0ABT2LPL0_9HYPH|nr:TetR/AcrR family transcriptional regulator [Chelativorans sp. EGI FJ00035]MCT7376485.1 TetR/AcrR family transcriptional regulator [Chelativorans sp. EGI FJ00035]
MGSVEPTIEPRKKPRQARSTATVDAILEASARILTAEGLAGFNTNAVALRAGISVGSLYQYFPSKEAILTEMLRRKRKKLLAGMIAALEGMERQDEEVIIKRLVKAAMGNQARAPKLAQALDYANSALPLHEEMMRTNRAVVEAVARFLALRAVPDSKQAAQDVVGLARGMMLQAFREDAADEEALARRICLAIRGYLTELRGETAAERT